MREGVHEQIEGAAREAAALQADQCLVDEGGSECLLYGGSLLIPEVVDALSHPGQKVEGCDVVLERLWADTKHLTLLTVALPGGVEEHHGAAAVINVASRMIDSVIAYQRLAQADWPWVGRVNIRRRQPGLPRGCSNSRVDKR